jgi:hypothetical protein
VYAEAGNLLAEGLQDFFPTSTDGGRLLRSEPSPATC